MAKKTTTILIPTALPTPCAPGSSARCDFFDRAAGEPWGAASIMVQGCVQVRDVPCNCLPFWVIGNIRGYRCFPLPGVCSTHHGRAVPCHRLGRMLLSKLSAGVATSFQPPSKRLGFLISHGVQGMDSLPAKCELAGLGIGVDRC